MKSTNDPTEIFGKTESKEGYFILHNFWPVFKFHQILGLFPCKKVSNELGQTQLQPMKTWMTILLFFTWMLFLIVPPVGTQMYFEMKLSNRIAPIISNTTYKTDVRPYSNNHYLTAVFLKLVQCQPRLNREIRPIVVEGVRFNHT